MALQTPALAQTLAAASCVLICASVASANASVGLVFDPLIDLVLATVILGIVEGAALGTFTRSAPTRAMIPMIAANLVSLIAGLFALHAVHTGALRFAGEPPIAAEWFALIAAALAAWALTILIEWPFTWWGTRGSTLSLRARFGMHTLVQTITTAIVLTLTLLPDGLSFIREFRDASPEAVLAGAPRFSVYAMDNDGAFAEIRWDRTRLHTRPLGPAPAEPAQRRSRFWGVTDRDGVHSLVWSDDCAPAVPSHEIAPGYGGMLWAFDRGAIGPAPFSHPPSPHRAWQDLRADTDPPWYPRVMVHDRSLRVRGPDDTPLRILGHRSALGSWRFSDVIVVQDRLVLAVMHNSSQQNAPRIVALDLQSNTMAILGPGARAYAELDGAPASTR